MALYGNSTNVVIYCLSYMPVHVAHHVAVLYRLSKIRENEFYLKTADRLVNFLKALQLHNSKDPNMNGAIAGSFPLLGGYMTAGYPNWATKYFLDALLLQETNSGRL